MSRTGVAAVALLLAGCGGLHGSSNVAATSEIKNATGQTVAVARFNQAGNVVRVVIEAHGLPAGAHAVHVHSVGKCDPPDFTSAGPHFNPSGKQHGALNPQGPHAGDLPNITIAADGTGRMETATEQLSLASGVSPVFDADGSAVVIHADPDDFKTDPTGNSGARIACGVLVKSPSP